MTMAIPVAESNGLAIWAQGAREVHRLAETVANSSLVPTAYRGKPIDVLACWLTGQEVGIPPMASLRSIDVIKGTPSLKAHAMRALVQSHGHDVEIVESDAVHCVMRGRRKGLQTWQTVTWTIDRAKQMGLIGKVAEGKTYDPAKDQWVAQPGTMLIARATGEVCRLVAADVLFAIPYATEEVRDDDEPITATAAVDRSRPASIAEIINPAGVTAPVETQVDGAPVDIGDAPEAATAAQMRNLHRLFAATGRSDRDLGLTFLSLLLDRPVESTKTLSKKEASEAIDVMQAEVDANREPAPDETP